MHDYKLHRTTNLYAVFNVATGEVLGRLTLRHRATHLSRGCPFGVIKKPCRGPTHSER